MISVTYVSAATALFRPSELLSLLQRYRKNNERLGLTGMLLFKNGNFMQILEGDEQPLRDVYRKIALDNRHSSVVKLLDHPIPHRQFQGWPMAFTNLDTISPKSIPGYAEFLETPLTPEAFEADPTKAAKLLKILHDRL